MTKEETVARIKESAKYKGLWEKTIERVVGDCLDEDEARRRLHQIWGAYFGIRPNFRKLLTKTRERRAGGESEKEVALWLMQMQSSTKERAAEMESFYRQIFEITKGAKTVVDYGCGMNALSRWWWPEEAGWSYLGVDIDLEELEFLRQVTGEKFMAGDILIDELPKADMYWLFKLLPVLEMQKKGAALEILRTIPARWIVVTYPVRSIGGRKKGMEVNYMEQFEKLVDGMGWKIVNLECKGELAFVVDKGEILDVVAFGTGKR